jgi:hypothetical protein
MKSQKINMVSISNKPKHSFQNLVLFAILLSCLLLSFFSRTAYSEGKIVKWKDEKGNTHYGDSVPAQYANTENSVISPQGITIKRNKPNNNQTEAIDAAKQEQDKKDKALISSFSNATEIDLARDRNLQLDLVAVESLQLQKNNSLKRLTENQNLANNLIKKHKPVPADLSAEIKSNIADIAKQDQLINERKTVMENTKKRFDDDKIRFLAIKNKTNDL